jgi:hypothetical protein
MVRRCAWCLAAASVLVAACGDGGGLPDARVIDGTPPGGTLSLTWTLADGDTAVTCDQVGAATVTLSIVPVDQPFGITEAFGCTSTRGTTGVIAAGAYDVTVSLGGGGAVAPSIRRLGVEVRSNADTALEPVAFDIDATGGLRARAAAFGVTGNCMAAPAGAGIDGITLRLRTSAGACVPTTFAVSAGAALPATTFMDDCAAPTPAACIDADQDIVVASAPSGRYRFAIEGLVGGTACWTASPAVRIPAGGAEVSLGTVNLLRSSAPACAKP